MGSELSSVKRTDRRRDEGRRGLLVAPFVLLACLSVGALFAPEARADGVLAATLEGHGLYRPGSFGGTVIADLGARFGVFSLGGGLGAAALSSDDAERSRAFMPLALSAGVALGETWRVRFRARGGLWAGAVNEGLRAGPFASAGAYLDVPLGPDAWFTVGTDGWLMAGGDTILLFAPGIGLAWNFGGSGL